MGRPARKARFLEERRVLARMIDAALKAGQRGDGTRPQFWEPWTDVGFAEKAGASTSSVGEWRDTENPTRPANIVPTLRVLYGNIPQYAEAREAMRHAWQRADGIDSDDLPNPRLIDAPSSFKEVAEVAVLTLNQPTPLNDGTLKVPYNLRFFRHENREIRIKVKGKPVTVTMDIGLTRPIFAVESKVWQPVQDTIFRGRRHDNTIPGSVADSVVIVQPVGNHGCVVDEPLKDEAHVIMEKTGAGEDGPIAFSVKVPRDGISVVLPEGKELSATQKDVLDAIFASAIPRDSNNRLTVESKVSKPAGAQSGE